MAARVFDLEISDTPGFHTVYSAFKLPDESEARCNKEKNIA